MNEASPAVALAALLDSAREVYDAYQASGPDRVDRALYEPVAASVDALAQSLAAHPAADEDWHTTLAAANTVNDLARRCACTPLGLCFISGEAGLIPRRDQHEAMERALDVLETARARLEHRPG